MPITPCHSTDVRMLRRPHDGGIRWQAVCSCYWSGMQRGTRSDARDDQIAHELALNAT